MDWWIIGLLLTGLLGTVVTVLLLLPVNLSVSLQAKGEPDGIYGAAGGAKFGPVTGTFVMSPQLPFRAEMRLFGRTIKRSERPVAEQFKLPSFIEGKLDPLEIVTFLLEERRRIALEKLDVDLSYSFRNVARTGQLLASLVVLSALLPARVTLCHTPSWELESRLQLSLEGRIRVWPGRLVLDTLRFGIHAFMLKRRKNATATRALEAGSKP